GQQPLRHGAYRHPRRRLPRARPLQDVAQVVAVVLQAPGQVGMARARTHDGFRRGLEGLGPHAPDPVLVVAVHDRHRDGAAEGLATAHAAQDAHAVGLDLHAAAAPVALLTTGEVTVDVRGE